jgi:hypothetical protein
VVYNKWIDSAVLRIPLMRHGLLGFTSLLSISTTVLYRPGIFVSAFSLITPKVRERRLHSKSDRFRRHSRIYKLLSRTPSSNSMSSIATGTIRDRIQKIQDVIGTDAGNRGMKALIVKEDLLLASYIFGTLPTASTVVVLSGFPCCVNETPPTETDGPPGTMSLARTAVALGHNAVVVVDDCNSAVFEAALHNLALPDETKRRKIRLETFPPDFNDAEENRFQDLAKSCDLLLACERAGPGKDGICYTMRGIDMNSRGLIAPLHRFVLERKDGVAFIAIGDGGNELGMGKVIDAIRESPQIPNGNEIGCVVSADHLVAASVSNWGGYALSAAAALIRAEHDSTTKTSDDLEKTVRNWVHKCLPTEPQEVELLRRCVEAGCRDGVSGKIEETVDGMSFETSLKCLQEIRNTALNEK